ncbi:MAG: hypothetical protein ACYS8W_10715 [Planctomycetota bacterium]|jgi:hypothetical protein
MWLPYSAFARRSTPGERKFITSCLPVIAIVIGLGMIIYSLFAGPAGESDGTSLSVMEVGMLSVAAGLLVLFAAWLLDRLFG